MKKRNYQKTESDVVIVVATQVVVDIAKSTVITVATDQAVIGTEFYACPLKNSLWFEYSHHCILFAHRSFMRKWKLEPST